MFTRVTLSDFRDAFRAAGRKDQFSYDGLRVIFDYLEEYEESTGESVELDVVTICCDYVEKTFDEVCEDYNVPHDAELGILQEDVREFLEDNTVLLGQTKDTYVFAQF